MLAQYAGRLARGFLLTAACLGVSVSVSAQTFHSSQTSSLPRFPTVDPGHEATLEARVHQLEARIAVLSRQIDGMAARAHRPTTADGATSQPAMPSPWSDVSAPVPGLPDRAKFGPGFALQTADEEYQWQFHNLSQFDGRFFQQGGQTPVTDTFAVPRQWFMFSGRLTKPYEYFVSLAHGFEAVSLLDVYLNLHFDDRLQIKIGRYFVPFTFEPYVLPIHALITPEWSLFFNNFEPNRELGVMAWGQLARKRLDYAAGIFNGTRNALVDTNDAKDFIGFLNARPFGEAGIPALANLNVGGSVNAGNEQNDPIPRTLRTVVSIPGNATIGVPFLTFNNDVRESGERVLWSLHMAYYYRHLSLIGEWDGGFQDYAVKDSPRIRLPVRSFFLEAGYFLTGETVAARGTVEPLRPFDLRRGRFGLGAWEVGGRYNGLELGDDVFNRGLADPNLWTNRVATIDVGLNWYLTQYVKMAIFWEHAEFGSPVLYRPGARQLTSDLFLVRFQLRF
jgi:phosphate-selective porin OprO/OprP